MANSKIVMQDWAEELKYTLKLAVFEVTLLKIYVDDVRNNSTSLILGLRYNLTRGDWEWDEKSYKEDMVLRSMGESRNARMIRLIMPIINSINPDLTFTAEQPDDFESGRMPTLDFEMWQEGAGGEELCHNYYQKTMKTPFVVMKRSALS